MFTKIMKDESLSSTVEIATPETREPSQTCPEVLTILPEELADRNRKFQGIPGIAGARDGQMWATWYGGGKREDEHNVVFLATSRDGGDTWTGPVRTIATPGRLRCFDPVIWCDPRGRMWSFWAQAVTHGFRPAIWAMVLEEQDNASAAWGAPFFVAPGVMMNKPTVLSDGRWLLPISNWQRPPFETENPRQETAEVWLSADEGKSFAFFGAATSDMDSKDYDEHMIVELKSERLWMLVRMSYGIGQSFSDDGGKSWSAVEPCGLAHPASRFFIRRLASGNLILVKHGPIEQSVGREDLRAYVSEDDGASWSGGLLLDPRLGVSYPDGFQADDESIHIVYDFQRRDAKEILMASFTEVDAKSGTDVSGKVRLQRVVNKAHAVAEPPK